MYHGKLAFFETQNTLINFLCKVYIATCCYDAMPGFIFEALSNSSLMNAWRKEKQLWLFYYSRDWFNTLYCLHKYIMWPKPYTTGTDLCEICVK